ncbi:MAG: hypothetical protein ANABAC_0571 [Anaerolineae bacterium]|nr:MAG: hypothetical protein ANABAC_0571 [Anaerolineae bacterium]
MIQIDGALYPDRDIPESLDSLEEQIDFIARLCSAWDFGLLPEVEVVQELCKPEWRQAIDSCRLLTSPTYHLLRKWQGLPPLPFLGRLPAYILEDPNLEFI